MDSKLWYVKEADVWEEALPIGNGRIGAMVFSGAIHDRLQLNEDTLWSGYPNRYSTKHSMDEVKEIRKLVQEKKYVEATERTSESMFGYRSQAYVPYGSLFVDVVTEKSQVMDYRRELDMGEGVLKCCYSLNGNRICKESFVSLTEDVLVMHIQSSEPISCHVYEVCELEHRTECIDGNEVVTGRCPTMISKDGPIVEYHPDEESIQFCSGIRLHTDGSTWRGFSSIWVDQAKEITLLFSIRTSFNGYQKMPISEGKEYIHAAIDTLDRAFAFAYEDLRKHHVEAYRKLFDRVSLRIDGEDYRNLPTDERIRNAANGTVDNGLVTLLFDFARYLTIASSLPVTQPANLQGIWSYKLLAPWHSNYTMNINAQMNYWPTETCDLGECHLPFLKLIKELSEKGNVFGLKGWMSWHNCDIWRFNYESTKGVLWGYWPMGGFWAVRHIWEHYLHTRDLAFLKEYYPVMTGAVAFLKEWMFENENGELSTCPSTSPENEFLYEGKSCSVCEGSAMDMSIIRDLLEKTIAAGKLLGEDTNPCSGMLAKLKPIKIGNDGRILEWGEELLEKEPGHRHISHLYGFFPSDIMKDPIYRDAVRKTLESRIQNGGGHTGWSNAWLANVYARLGDGEHVMKHIRTMFRKSIYPNMFDAHPPFQIDGNFGIASAICEALLQSHTGEIKLIPAIPAEWESGEVHGMVTRTGEKISFRWKNQIAERIE